MTKVDPKKPEQPQAHQPQGSEVDRKVDELAKPPILSFGASVKFRYAQLRSNHSWSTPSSWRIFAGIRAFFTSIFWDTPAPEQPAPSAQPAGPAFLQAPLSWYLSDKQTVPSVLQETINSFTDAELEEVGLTRITPNKKIQKKLEGALAKRPLSKRLAKRQVQKVATPMRRLIL